MGTADLSNSRKCDRRSRRTEKKPCHEAPESRIRKQAGYRAAVTKEEDHD
jgi:hypothetical protein